MIPRCGAQGMAGLRLRRVFFKRPMFLCLTLIRAFSNHFRQTKMPSILEKTKAVSAMMPDGMGRWGAAFDCDK